MNNTARHVLLIITITCLLINSSCKTKKVSSDIEISNSRRIEYYKPFYEPVQYKTNIYALTNVNSVYKAANNFSLNEMFIVNVTNDSIYIIKSNLNKIYPQQKNNLTIKKNLIPAKAEDVKKYEKLKSFISNQDHTKLVFSSSQNNNKEIWNVYLVYSTAVNDQLKSERLPLSYLTDIKELTILDLSATVTD